MKDPKHTEMIICGKTGDKVLFPSKILGHACALSGKYCAVSPSVEPIIRGGLIYCDIIVSNDEVDYFKTQSPDILVALSQGAYDIFSKKITKRSAAIFFDPETVLPDKNIPVKHYALAVLEKTRKELKTDKIADTVLLACIVRLTRIASIDSLNKALKAQLKDDVLTLNLKALELGTRLARKIRFP